MEDQRKEINMEIDLNYIKGMLNVWKQSEKPSITINDLADNGFSIYSEDKRSTNDKFIFHYQLLVENQLISNMQLEHATMKNTGIGLVHNNCTLTIVDLRLTQLGHDFASTLDNREVFERLKSDFKDAPFKIIFESGRKLIEHYFKKKLDDITEEG